jgi:retron-type reverse transcriptase
MRRQSASAHWVLEGDIRGCFENISRDWLLANTPMDKAILRKWLRAGYVDQGRARPCWHAIQNPGVMP